MYFDKSSLCKMARMVPKPKSTGNSAVDADLQSQRRAFMKIVDHLWTHPHDRLRVWAFMETPVEKQRAASDQDWDMSVAYIPRLPKYWKAQWMVTQTQGQASGFSQSICDLVDAHDTTAIDKLFRLFTETRPTTRLPMACRRSKDICAKTFAARAQMVKASMADFAPKFIKSNGAIDWINGGAYRLEWVENKVVSITYGDKASVPNGITKEFVTKDPWDHLAARADGPGAAKYMLADYFPPGEGPHRNALDKRSQLLDNIADKLEKEKNDAEQAAKQNTFEVSENFVGQGASDARKKRLQEAQKRAVASVKRRRLVRLASQ